MLGVELFETAFGVQLMYSIVQAANILEISEYDVLGRAYIAWYGRAASNATIQRVFSDYIKNLRPPHWAQHYARKVIEDFEREHCQSGWVLNYIRSVWAVKRQEASVNADALQA